MVSDEPTRGGDEDCVFLAQWRDELAEVGTDWCGAEYRRYATCCESRADEEVCDGDARAAEECALGSGVPTPIGAQRMQDCLELCEVSGACLMVFNFFDCALYQCFSNRGAPLESAQYEDDHCAGASNEFYACIRSSVLTCTAGTPCDEELAILEDRCTAYPARGFSPLFDGCAAHCESRHLADAAVATSACMESLCLNRADGHRLEEKPLRCHAAIAMSADCFVLSSNGVPCDEPLAAVAAACDE